jgi:uncharacterized membrane protein YqjE
VLQEVRSLSRELRRLFHDHVSLAALEARQAGESLIWMLTLGVMVSGLLLSAWLGLLATLVLTLIEHGVMTSPSMALLLAVGTNLLLAVILGWALRRRLPHLQFPATVRSLTRDREKSS